MKIADLFDKKRTNNSGTCTNRASDKGRKSVWEFLEELYSPKDRGVLLGWI